jgi:hypothetical protein
VRLTYPTLGRGNRPLQSTQTGPLPFDEKDKGPSENLDAQQQPTCLPTAAACVSWRGESSFSRIETNSIFAVQKGARV